MKFSLVPDSTIDELLQFALYGLPDDLTARRVG